MLVGSREGEIENVKPRGVVSSGQLAETQSTKLSTNSRISVRLERERRAGSVGWPALPEQNWNHTSTSCRQQPLGGCSYKSEPWSPSHRQPPPCSPSLSLLKPEERNKNRRNISLRSFSELKEEGEPNLHRGGRASLWLLLIRFQGTLPLWPVWSGPHCVMPSPWMLEGDPPTHMPPVPTATGDPRSNCSFPELLFRVPSQGILGWLMKLWPQSRETPKLAQREHK